jgi:hypothetical protein
LSRLQVGAGAAPTLKGATHSIAAAISMGLVAAILLIAGCPMGPMRNDICRALVSPAIGDMMGDELGVWVVGGAAPLGARAIEVVVQYAPRAILFMHDCNSYSVPTAYFQ